jgi:putative NADH-flavin reductase
VAHVLVIGASGGIGRETLSAALDAGHRVRAFSRSANEIDLESSELEKRPGDAMKATDVDAALDGIDVVVQALGIGADELFKPVDLFSESTRILLAAMQRRQVRRLIAVTGFGAGDSREAIGCLQRIPFRLFLGRAYDDKDVQERLIKKSGLDWTIVRPGILTNSSRTGRYRVLVEPSQWRNGVISRADVADFIVGSMDDDDRIHQAPVLIW